MALAMNCRKLCGLTTKYLQSSIVSNVIVRHSAYKSNLFPGYEVIYSHDSIVKAVRWNKMKQRVSIVTVAGIPLVKGLEYCGIFNSDVVYNFGMFGIAVLMYFHGVGFFCNNVIGYIYRKDDTDDVKFSYVDYFGRRKDLDAKLDDVWFPQSRFNNAYFKIVNIDSPKKQLKLCPGGKILDEERFLKLSGVCHQT